MKYFRSILALCIAPVAGVAAWNFLKLVVQLGNTVSAAAAPFWVGLGSYFLFQAVFARPIRTYVFGHELTHALVGILSGARLKSFKVSSGGGSVSLTKTGVLIALAPYFVPLYTVMVLGVYWLGGKFWPLHEYHAYFLFAAGFTLAFHFGLTYFALAQGQSDLKQFGVFFSGVFILLVSSLLLSALLKGLFPRQVSLRRYVQHCCYDTVHLGRACVGMGRDLWTSYRSTK